MLFPAVAFFFLGGGLGGLVVSQLFGSKTTHPQKKANRAEFLSLKKAATKPGGEFFFWVLKKGAQIWWTGTSARSKPPKGTVHCCLLASASCVRELERWQLSLRIPGIAGIFSLKLRDKHLFSKPELYISHMLGQGPQVLKIKHLQLS